MKTEILLTPFHSTMSKTQSTTSCIKSSFWSFTWTT